MAKLSYRQVEAFRAVMIAGTTTGAAELLYISQPAVSRLLNDFEAAVQVKLFERHHKRLAPTPEALLLFEEVERSFVGIDRLATMAEELRDFQRGSLKVAAMPAIALGFLPKVMQSFSEQHKGVTLTLQVRSSQQVADWIATQHFDIGIGAVNVADPSLAMEVLGEAALICALPANHPLAAKAVIVPEDLRDQPFISLGPEQSVRYKVDEAFEKARVSRQLVFDTQLSHVACSFVDAGAGVALVDPITALHFPSGNLVFRPFEPWVSFSYHLMYPAHRARSRATQEFSLLLKQKLRELVANSGGLLRLGGEQ
ncbi:LysR substrate-binding domain-containing protein [Zobellella maritima]|uniref:LysR substrate-binding domain-containing protein n=1 Tax=Zobellella maritima TaxID=2059725 RepID=UPI000E3043C0|nr:LysR substrate-binding domain-containing protein [Zobellella maritima]